MICPRCSAAVPAGAPTCATCGAPQTYSGAVQVATTADPEGGSAESGALLDRVRGALTGRYAVDRLLGSGGMASVFLAQDVGLERAVAIKVLPIERASDARVVARFQREARLAAKLDHPNIIPIYRVDSEGPLHYFVMKYVEGQSLERLMEERGPLDLALARQIMADAAAALAHAHRKGVIHRDVKPANIMLDGDGRAILTDFGISRAAEGTSELTQTGTIMGTPFYMAPEQILGRPVDERADQYSLAVLAFQLVTGRLPFDGETPHAVLYQHVHEPPPRPVARRPDLPQRVEDAILRGLAKDPAERFATVDDFGAAVCDASDRPERGDRAATARGPSITTVGARASAVTRPLTPLDSAPTVVRDGRRFARDLTKTSPSRGRGGPGAVSRLSRWLWASAAVMVVSIGVVMLWFNGRSPMPFGRHTSADASASQVAQPSPLETPPTPQAQRDSVAPGTNAPADAEVTPAGTGGGAPSQGSGASSPTVVDHSSATTPLVATELANRPEAMVRSTSRPRSAHRGNSAAPAQPGAGEPSRQTATLTVDSQPWGTVYIDGVEAGPTPLADYAVTVGRSYEIRVEHDGFKPHHEVIAVTGPNPIRRRYVLDPVTP